MEYKKRIEEMKIKIEDDLKKNNEINKK